MKQSAGDQKRETFIVTVLDTQNATWQGTVSWTEAQKTQSFRSALELIRLMDSVLGATTGSEPEEEAEASS